MQRVEPSTESAEIAAEARDDCAQERGPRGLLLVGIFKMCKAVFFGLMAAGALDLVHRNMGDLAQRLVTALPINPTGHIASMVLDRADMVSNHHLRMAGMGSAGYACVCVVEGVGLLMRKVWAEYVTVVLTVLALPYECFEIWREVTSLKMGLLGLNLVVLGYLIWVLRRKRGRSGGNAVVCAVDQPASRTVGS